MSLYRKYRPQDFDNLIGQEHIKTTLLNAIQQEKISHAYLFCGPRGTGKTTTARLIAKAINCDNISSNGEPCNKCFQCMSANESSLVDLIEIDAASNRGIDEIRDLREKIRFAPSQAKNKVYIIDEVHMLTKEAFNALLKTLEEPPPHVFFIIATTETHKVPATIISRCQRFDFHRISIDSLINRLKHIAEMENIKYEIEALELIANMVKGGLRDAISILDQLSHHGDITVSLVKNTLGLSDSQAIADLFQALIQNDPNKSLELLKNILTQGANLTEFLREFLEYVRKMMILTVKGEKNINLQKILEIIDAFSSAKTKISQSIIEELPVEAAIVSLCNKYPTNESNPQTEKKATATITHATQKAHSPISKNTEPNTILNKWPEILELFNPPPLRQNLKQAKPEINNDMLILNFASDFHFDKFNAVENLYTLEKIINEFLKIETKIICKLNKTENSQSKDENIESILNGEW